VCIRGRETWKSLTAVVGRNLRYSQIVLIGQTSYLVEFRVFDTCTIQLLELVV
jgi:hypothetical protein